MIKNIKKRWKNGLHSLKFRMLMTTILAFLAGVLIFFAVDLSMDYWIEHYYSSEKAKELRYEEYIDDLQTYIDKNKLSSEDTYEISNWMKSNRNVYLFLYKDGQLFFDGSLEENLKPGEGKDDSNDLSDDESNLDGVEGENDKIGDKDENWPSAPQEQGNLKGPDNNENSDSEKESSDESKEGEDFVQDQNGNGGFRPGGITLEYPTRDEIIERAEKNGLLPIELSDGTLFVSLVDFTEYVYYDLSNIVSIISGVVAVILILMLYFRSLTAKISNLAKDVSSVYESDMNKKIRVLDGSDEFSNLTRNVEHMRYSMLESLKNEKAAIDANTELITSMSHDIRTPLTVLLGYLDIMKAYSSDVIMDEYIKASEVTAARLKELSDDMFRYFLVYSGKNIDVSITDYESKTFLNQLLSEHILLMNEKGYVVNIYMSDTVSDNTRVSTDASQLMRVIDNLFSNLYKYADKEREISVFADISEIDLVLKIENYISGEASKAESNGIGLRTCKKICDVLKADFEYKTDEDKFIVTVTMPLGEN